MAGGLVSLIVLMFHSSVKLRWIASCCMESDPPSITDILLLQKCDCILIQLNIYAFLFYDAVYIFIAAFV